MNFTKILLALCCGFTLYIESQSYNFNTTTGTYSNLVGSTSLNNNTPWDDPEYTIPIGFNFTYFNTTTTQFHLRDWGDGAYLTTQAVSTGIVPLLIPYGADIIDRAYDLNNINATTGSVSNISYLLEGTSGNRILKIEWRNVGFYDELNDLGTTNDFTNFQLWLYEGSNTIEMHYGPNSISNTGTAFTGEDGASISLIQTFDIDNEEFGSQSALELTGAPNAPNMISTTLFDETFLNNIIPNGTIYQFNNASLSTNYFINQNSNIKLSPNPTANSFKLLSNKETPVKSLTIINANGRIIKEIKHPKKEIDISFLTQGIYFVNVKTAFNTITKKVIKI